MKGWIDENECDASAIRRWRSHQGKFGCAACLTMSMMGGDLMQPPAIVDWNTNFADHADTCLCTHCGNSPTRPL